MPDNPQPPEIPQGSEGFRTLPNPSEQFGTIRKVSERNENHTLTVREVTRMFEAAGVARTERSVVNWCQPNRMGMARLDCYFDPNERKYFITMQSVELAVAEEKAKAAKLSQENGEPSATVPKISETRSPNSESLNDLEADSERLKAFEKEVLDLKILNRGKDYFIEQLQKEREGFALERREYVEKLMSFNQKVGQLETQLRLLKPPIN